MRRLKKFLAVSMPMMAAEPQATAPDDTPQEEIEDLLLGMFRDLPQDQRLTILDIVAEVYSLAKRRPC